MPNNNYKLSRSAQTHLRNIKSYTVNNFSETQWQSYKNTLLTGLKMLAANPEVGRSCDDIYPGGFYFPVGKHTAYFTKENGFIVVVAVLGQSQLPQNHL
ncbi:type II toxin-antitoxin system RelE/ParE family toxin [Salinibius halmophilus]|uniref:type II toxin-antitoxin system RelE/ParE family toxin n=1 Tax=Salinibius halmophilus TaxID=1853216 RepID=UPI000E66AF58|nr:type II toxin-antitoxin system RelE/ParE family toxin [Salinibius halmophilus]